MATLHLDELDITELLNSWNRWAWSPGLTEAEAQAWARLWHTLWQANRAAVNSADTKTPTISSLADLV